MLSCWYYLRVPLGMHDILLPTRHCLLQQFVPIYHDYHTTPSTTAVHCSWHCKTSTVAWNTGPCPSCPPVQVMKGSCKPTRHQLWGPYGRGLPVLAIPPPPGESSVGVLTALAGSVRLGRGCLLVRLHVTAFSPPPRLVVDFHGPLGLPHAFKVPGLQSIGVLGYTQGGAAGAGGVAGSGG